MLLFLRQVRCFEKGVIMSKATEDRRTQYSKKMIRESLYVLMKEKPLNKISVTEICKKADVNRSTFYSYYTDIYDLHQKILKEFFLLQRNVIKHIKETIRNKSALSEFTYDDFHNIVYYYLKTVEENTDLYKFRSTKMIDKKDWEFRVVSLTEKETQEFQKTREKYLLY